MNWRSPSSLAKRARDQDIQSLKDFNEQDEKQCQFGALRIGSELADITISNDGTIEQYQNRISAVFEQLTRAVSSPSGQKEKQLSELHRCLAALARFPGAASCEQISDETAKFGPQVRIYNTNR